jgi:hypothetical protein
MSETSTIESLLVFLGMVILLAVYLLSPTEMG